MQSRGKVSPIPGANTVFEGQEIHREKKRHRDKDTDRRGIKDADQEDPSSRSKEGPGPLRDTTSEGPSTLSKKDCSDD
jgi:hypothetical protein